MGLNVVEQGADSKLKSDGEGTAKLESNGCWNKSCNGGSDMLERHEIEKSIICDRLKLRRFDHKQ